MALLCALLAMPACKSNSGSGQSAAYPPLVPGEFGAMHNVSTAGPIWIGGMPSAEDLELAQRRGIEKIIDVSVPTEPHTCDVSSECGSLGLEYASAGLVDAERLTSESVDLVMAELEGPDLPPTLLFCGSGSRCAMYLAIYRVTHLDVPLEEALIEARRAGMQAGESAEFVRHEVERLQARDSEIQISSAQ